MPLLNVVHKMSYCNHKARLETTAAARNRLITANCYGKCFGGQVYAGCTLLRIDISWYGIGVGPTQLNGFEIV